MGESSSSTEVHPSEIILARWTERFVAWLIDFVIVSIGLAILFALISIPFWIYYAAEDVEEQLTKSFSIFVFSIFNFV
jgi:hypothetical protein